MILAPVVAVLALLAEPSSEPLGAARYEYVLNAVDAAGVARPDSKGVRLGLLVAPSDDGLLVLLEAEGASRLAFRTVPARLARDTHMAFQSDEVPAYATVVNGEVVGTEYPSWPLFDLLADTVAFPATLIEAVRNGFPGRWRGAPWAKGSTWRDWRGTLEVGEPCEVNGTRGVNAVVLGAKPRASEHVACISPDLPFPLSSVGSAGISEPHRFRQPERWSARLAVRTFIEGRDVAEVVRLWRRSSVGGIALAADRTGSEIAGLPPLGPMSGAGACERVRSFAWAWDGTRALELGSARMRGGVNVSEVVRALRVAGSEESPVLTEAGAWSPARTGDVFSPAAGNGESCRARPASAAPAPAKAAPPAKRDLYDAAVACDRELTRSLLAGGADPRRKHLFPQSPYNQRRPEPPIHAAAFCGDPALVRALLDKGADPNASMDGAPVLSRALTGGAPEVVALLLARGARRDARTDDGSLFARTVQMNRRDLYEAFLQAGASPGLAEVLLAVDAADPSALQAALAASGGIWAKEAREHCGPRCRPELAPILGQPSGGSAKPKRP
jgi:hypothetical protein